MRLYSCLPCLQMSKFLVKFSCLSKGDLVAASLIHTTQAQPSAKAIDEVMASPAKPQASSAADAADGSKGQKGGGKGSKKGKKQAAGAEEEDEDAAEQLQFEQSLGADGDLGTGLGAYEAAYGEKGAARVQEMPKTLHIQDALRTLVKEFFARMPSAKCQNCGCLNPSIKKQGASKLFKQYSRRALLQNFARGIDVAAAVAGGAAAAEAAMQRLQEPAAAEDDDDAAAAAAEGGKKRKRAAAGASAEEQQAQKKQGLTGDVFEDKAPVPSVIKKQLEEQEDWVSHVQ